MVTAILQTKLHIPTPPRDHVSRQRLLERLDAGLQSNHRLILVSAPAGFGKTTLLSEWIAQGDFKTAWISLDESENDPLRFLTYFIAALQNVNPTFGEDILSIISSPQPPPVDVVLTTLLNQLTGHSDSVILVLDDYHLIENRDIHQGVAFFIENLPPHVCLVILSRADPPMPSSRLRARGQMTELRAADLRFTTEEVIPFLKQGMQLDLSPDQIRALESRTEGWIAGLQMVALSLKGKTDIEEFLFAFSGSHRFILDYLTDEVLRVQPKEIQDFILQTSILDRLCGPLCEAVTGQDSGQEILEKLDESNLFLIPLDDERCWYRYHRLFADVMTNRLQRYHPEQVSAYHSRAAKWFRENAFYAEAIDHAIVAGDTQFASEIVEDQAMGLLVRGSVSTLSGWLQKFPPEIIAERPPMAIFSAWTLLLTGKIEKIDDVLVTAEDKLEKRDGANDWSGQIAAIRAYQAAMLGDPNRAVELSQIALDLLDSHNLAVRCVVVYVLGGVHFMRQDIPSALAAMKEAAQLGEKAGNIHVAVPALNSVADILKGQGNLGEAERVYFQALELGTGSSGRPLPITAGVHSGLAEIRLRQNDLAAARQFAQTGLELGEKWGNADSLVSCCLASAQIEATEGNLAEARAALEKAKTLAATHHLTPGQNEQIIAFEAAIFGTPDGGIDQSLLPEPLTERELEVLHLLAAGMSNRAIADELVIALGTTKTHISRIMGKLEAENRTQAVKIARELGLIPK